MFRVLSEKQLGHIEFSVLDLVLYSVYCDGFRSSLPSSRADMCSVGCVCSMNEEPGQRRNCIKSPCCNWMLADTFDRSFSHFNLTVVIQPQATHAHAQNSQWKRRHTHHYILSSWLFSLRPGKAKMLLWAHRCDLGRKLLINLSQNIKTPPIPVVNGAINTIKGSSVQCILSCCKPSNYPTRME